MSDCRTAVVVIEEIRVWECCPEGSEGGNGGSGDQGFLLEN